MKMLHSVAEVRRWSREARGEGRSVGLVPTMGALHEGHASLVRAARAGCDLVVVSIFVNPTQFGPNEDFARYPRTFEEDCWLLSEQGVEAVFAPATEEVYPPGAATFVEVAGLSDRLDGGSRPGHFRGVATVVAKLILATEPERAYFGQKDAAQVSVLRRMTADLMLPVEMVVCPIVRETDGLAMSSRNRYLKPEERLRALVLSRALRAVGEAFAGGERSAAALESVAAAEMAREPEVRVDYVAAVDWATLEPVEVVRSGTLFAVAAYVGATRLIDNCILC